MSQITIAHNWVRKDTKERFIAVATELAAASRKEAGCISYRLWEDEQDALHLAFVEEWANAESLEAHCNSEHFKRLAPQLGECAAKEHDVLVLKRLLV